jgi:AcrR family transcriptional regulator
MRPAASGKLTRSQRNEELKRRLFEAAARIVGELGYEEASIARITKQAGVAQGTFYNHFASRRALLDELLPALGLEMARYIQDRTETIQPESLREIARFQAFFDYLRENPGFPRILNEAQFAAPAAFRRHIENMAAPYQRILKRARNRNELGSFSDAELEVIAHILMGARSYLSQRYASSTRSTPPFSALTPSCFGTGYSLEPKLIPRRNPGDKIADLTHRLSRGARKKCIHGQETMDHPRMAADPHIHPPLRELVPVLLGLFRDDVVLSGNDEGGWKQFEVGCA